MLDQPAVTKFSTTKPSIRHDWSVEEIVAIHDQPLLDLIAEANGVHRALHDPSDVQRASLLSIKTGGCPEDCAYCPQSAHHKEVKLDRIDLMDAESVLELAARAKQAGADRFCMGAAWRSVRDGREFDTVLTMVEGVRALGMEACVTLGMLNAAQAGRLKDAGLTAYNHNLDTGPDFYDKIISTRSYDDRLDTLQAVREAGIELCTGGIIAWARACVTARPCSTCWPASPRTRRACRSTPLFPSQARPSPSASPKPRSIRSSSCG